MTNTRDPLPNGNDVVHRVCERVAAGNAPSLAETQALLEQLAVAEVEIGLLRAALLDASGALWEVLEGLARQQRVRMVGAEFEESPATDGSILLAELYDFLLARTWERTRTK